MGCWVSYPPAADNPEGLQFSGAPVCRVRMSCGRFGCGINWPAPQRPPDSSCLPICVGLRRPSAALRGRAIEPAQDGLLWSFAFAARRAVRSLTDLVAAGPRWARPAWRHRGARTRRQGDAVFAARRARLGLVARAVSESGGGGFASN